jgi:hypothetical protein
VGEEAVGRAGNSKIEARISKQLPNYQKGKLPKQDSVSIIGLANAFARALPFAHLTIYPPASQLGVFTSFGNSNLFRASNFGFRIFFLRRAAVVDFHHAVAGAVVPPSQQRGVSAGWERRSDARLQGVCANYF